MKEDTPQVINEVSGVIRWRMYCCFSRLMVLNLYALHLQLQEGKVESTIVTGYNVPTGELILQTTINTCFYIMWAHNVVFTMLP